jgi:tetratricopeptide (TPR) repeat protein
MNTISVDEHDEFVITADNYLSRRLYEEALVLSKERLEIYPRDIDAMIVICQSWLGLDNLEEARVAFAALDKMHLRLAVLYKAMGDACLERGLKHEAVTYFRKGMILLPEAFEIGQQSQMMTDVLDAFDEGVTEDAGEESPAVNSDFYTMTMADLYMKQGHLEMAAEVLEAIRQREPDNEIAVDLLREIKGMIDNQSAERLSAAQPSVEQSAVIQELSRWLNNVDRIRSREAQVNRFA